MGDKYRPPRQKHPDGRVVALAANQYGVISRAQAIGCGMSKRMIAYRLASARWTALFPTVYVVFPADAWEQTLMGACLWGGEDAVASHRSAAALWGLDGIPKNAFDVSLPRSRRSPVAGVRVHASTNLSEADVTTAGSFPLTSVTRTLIDLGTVVTVDRVEEALDSALRRRMVTVARLRWRLDELGTRGKRGALMLHRLVNERPASTKPAESVLEVRLRRLIQSANLPTPSQQYEIVVNRKVVARCDFAYPSERLAIEADGYAFHSGKRRWQLDLARRTRLAQLGWRVMHVTDGDLRDRPDEVVQSIRCALAGEPSTFLP
jgi:very-short-patch-repair endonuclease